MVQQQIFNIKSTNAFNTLALQCFHYQYTTNKVYQQFCNHLRIGVSDVKEVKDIPFLPISFFKSDEIVCGNDTEAIRFTSSGTTGTVTSKHIVTDLTWYKKSYLAAFELFYGAPNQFCILALLPNYLERTGSSLIYMVDDLINQSEHADSGFYLNDLDKLASKLKELDAKGVKVLLIGVSFALLNLIEAYQFNLKHTIIMETGGMKGRRKELIREELHNILKAGFGVQAIHSEYGMTELLSQGYSAGNGVFNTPPWLKILVRDTEDPLALQPFGKSGGINVIDLANWNSCSFIATQDLGKIQKDGSFEILGRFDHSDVRGCNLMVL